jgi:predicted N-acetyltransferase YhbS
MTEFVPLSGIDPLSVERLLDAAFGTDRQSRTAYRMRQGVEAIPALSFGAVKGGALIGSIQCWPVALEEANGTLHSLTLVGPVAVSPDLQRSGIGRALMTCALAVADAGQWDALMMIGDPEYYGRFFGFAADQTGEWLIPGPVERRRLLARIRDGRSVPTNGRIIPDPAFALARASA